MNVTRSVLLVLIAVAMVSCQTGDAPTPELTSADEFEGWIEFESTFEVFTDGLPINELRAMAGDAYRLYYRAGAFKLEFQNGEVDWILYRSTDNKEYTLLRGERNLRVADGSTVLKTVSEITTVDSDEVILGHSVKVLRVGYADGSEDLYWYDPTLRIDSDHFSRLRYNAFYRTVGAMPLRHETRNSHYRIRSTAVAIESVAVNDSVFSLPKFPVESWESSPDPRPDV